MTLEEQNKYLAEKLGFTYVDHLHVYRPNGETICDGREWTPYTNLQQAADHIMPWLQDKWNITSTPIAVAKAIRILQALRIRAKGETMSERMAWALCKVFLQAMDSEADSERSEQ